MSYILTASGGRFYYDNMRRSDIRIEDIARALARKCRFAGHCSDFYSVAQHSLHVSQIVPKEYALAGLLHDATEAYMADIPTPLKHLLPDFKRLEKEAESVIMSVFNVNLPLAKDVKRADLIMLATEKRDFMPEDNDPWPILDGVAPLAERLTAWSSETAERLFLNRYYNLTEQRQGEIFPQQESFYE